MTDWTIPQTGKPHTPGEVADPTSQVSTSNKSAGDAGKFKLTREERDKIDHAISVWYKNRDGSDVLVNQIEAIINEGWQNCTCPVDTAV